VRIAVVGATGAVGTRMLRLLRERGVGGPGAELVAVASPRSAGRELEGGLVVRSIEDGVPEGLDIAIFSAGGGTSRAWAERYAASGAIVVDNSSAWRMDPEVPLVVAEVNPDALEHLPKGIVANPNCTTMAFMPPMKALHDAFGLRALVATSYQAAGGAGQSGIDELAEQVPVLAQDFGQLADDGAAAAAKVTPSAFAKTLAFNVVPWLGTEKEAGYTDEELKMRDESRKILGIPDLAVAPTCVRVPVVVGHAIELRATFEREAPVAAALDALRAMDGVELDDVPTPLEWAGRDPVCVGRVRQDLEDPRSLNLFVVGDNLLKGAALNTVQIAELLVTRGLASAAA
jgi:aspartate-semialdehyde dehydrogenase